LNCFCIAAPEKREEREQKKKKKDAYSPALLSCRRSMSLVTSINVQQAIQK
jgi:hypothetical protein